MSEPELRITIIRILAGVEKSLESLSAAKKEAKNSQNEIKNAITELQSRMDAAAGRMGEAEQRISDIEDNLLRIMKQKKRGRPRKKSTIYELDKSATH